MGLVLGSGPRGLEGLELGYLVVWGKEKGFWVLG